MPGLLDGLLGEMIQNKELLNDRLEHMAKYPKSYSSSEVARTAEAHARVCESISRIYRDAVREAPLINMENLEVRPKS